MKRVSSSICLQNMGKKIHSELSAFHVCHYNKSSLVLIGHNVYVVTIVKYCAAYKYCALFQCLNY